MTTILRGERVTIELDSKICKLQESCIQIENSMFSVCFRMPLAFSLVSQSRRTVHSKVARCCPTCRCAAGPPLVLFPVSSAAIAQQIDCVPIFPNQHVSPNFPTWCFQASPSLKSAFLKDGTVSAPCLYRAVASILNMFWHFQFSFTILPLSFQTSKPNCHG